MGPDTSAYQSCSAKLNGELFVFGGGGTSTRWKYSKQAGDNFIDAFRATHKTKIY